MLCLNWSFVGGLEKAIKLEIHRRYYIKDPHAMCNILKWLFSLLTNRTKSISGKFDSTLYIEKWLVDLKHPVMIVGMTVSLPSNKTVNNWKPNVPRYTSSQIWTASWSSYRASYVVLIGYGCCSIKYNCMWQATFHYSWEEGCGASEKWPSFWLYLNLKIFCLVTCHHSPIHIHYCL